MDLLDFLEAFGGFLFVDHAFAFTVLNVPHGLIMSLALFFVLGSLLLKLKFEELLLLLRDSLVLLPSLASELQALFSLSSSGFQLSEPFRSCHYVLLGAGLQVIDLLSVFLLERVVVALSVSL